MATLYRTTGFQEEIIPANGKEFSLRELQTLVGGYIEVVPTKDGRLMVLDEEGKLKGKVVNAVASALYLFSKFDPIVGEVVVGTPKEFGKDDHDEDEQWQSA